MDESIRDQIVEARKKRDLGWQITEEAQNFLEGKEGDLEKAFQERWDRTFPGVSVHFLSSRAEHYYLYEIDKAKPLDNGRWTKDEGYEFHEHATKFIDCPVAMEKLNQFMAEIEQETSLKVELSVQELKTRETIERLCTAADLQCKFGPFTVLEEGEVWYTGWDISDKFVIGQFPDGHIEVWYSVNGHGFGFDVAITEGETEELVKFYERLEEYKVSINTTKQQILESWRSDE